MKDQIIKNKARLSVKLFIVVWVVLLVHVLLKLTFNYWQPYVIPNETLQVISDFIDSHIIIKSIIDKLFWIVGTYFMILAGIRQWKFEKKYPVILILICAFLSAIDDYYQPLDQIIDTIVLIFALIVLPLIIDKKKWLYILITFALNFVFLKLSLWLEGFSTGDNMPYITATFLNIDYYIMLILNYFVFNLFRKKE